MKRFLTRVVATDCDGSVSLNAFIDRPHARHHAQVNAISRLIGIKVKLFIYTFIYLIYSTFRNSLCNGKTLFYVGESLIIMSYNS